jgi:hypothetical protein
MTDAFID